MSFLARILFVLPLALVPSLSWGQVIDLGDAVVVVRGDAPALSTVATVLEEEVNRRTGLHWERAAEVPPERACIEVALSADGAPGAEGFSLNASPEGRIQLVGADARGALFGAGYLLRKLDWEKGAVSLPGPFTATEKPEYAIRGHQLGYRARANSWDAWTPDQFDQFIRELALFGTNAIENIPFQDDQESPHFKLSRRDMNRTMSEICVKYDLAYWVWTPAEFELKDQAKRAAALKAHEELYADCPRLDGVFFPGGDPGDNHPSDVMPFLEEVSKLLLKHHPDARVWVSPQGFHGEKLGAMFDWIDEHKPEWLGGVVGGPGSPRLDGLRERLDPRYRLRDYPDITHIVRCQYPVLNLDQAFALTLGRECITARPVFHTMVHTLTAPFTDGFISYSDGVHDDANKILWSQLGWNSSQDPRDIMIDYCRFFFGANVATQAADGLFALEENWDGPIRHNGAIEGTLALWKNLEVAKPELKDNWRWQMYVLRAYYDAYTRERLFREQALEQKANALLTQAPDRTPAQAMEAALAILQSVDTNPIRPDLRNRILELFDDLYRSIGLQTDMKRHQASGAERGCSLEFLDYPLNNRWWLEDEFKKVAALSDAAAQWSRLDELRTWENPGPGSSYDDLGNLVRSPHVAREYFMLPMSGGFAWWDGGYSRTRLSWQVTSWPRDGLQYNRLDPEATYLLRFSGFGEMKARADDQELTATRYGTENGDIKEYPVPKELIKDGRLTVKAEAERLPGVNWRQQPRLSEAWLIKQ
jgi:hypothetical protein